jgi:predicted DNA-binding transcriptional regulator YafY
VASRGDPALARAALDLIAKIGATVPERLRPMVMEPATRAAPNYNALPDRLDMAQARRAIHEGRKIRLTYRDEQERETARTIWPFAVGYHEAVRLLLGWCELRQDFRSFRTDRVTSSEFLEERYPERPAALRARWRKHAMAESERMRAEWRSKAEAVGD